MPPRKKQEESPDPLLLAANAEEEIVAHARPHTPIKRPAKRARAGTLTSLNVDNQSASQPGSPTRDSKSGATPAGKSILVPTGSPTTSTKKGKAPAKPVYDSPARSKSAATSTLAESAKKKLPTPRKPISQPGSRPSTLPRAGSRVGIANAKIAQESPSKGAGGSSSVTISRQSFLANEQLKRQREARNFKYTGDADAPRLTRSGKVVGDVQQDDYAVVEKYPSPEELKDDPFTQTDEIGNDSLVADAFIQDNSDTIAHPQPEKALAKTLDPLPDFARSHMADVLSTLTSTHIADKPKPFRDELQNDTLLSLTKLLQGTIDRSEGNSALIAGPRGSGKTRVSSSSGAWLVRG